MQLREGQVAVVTGGASGIGLGLGAALLARGLHVVLSDVRADAVEEAAESLRASAGTARVLAVAADVGDPAAVDELGARTLAAFGRVDLVCNNAGVVPAPQPSWEQEAATWRWVLDVALLGVVHGIRTFVPHLLAQGSGHVLNTASVGGLIPLPMLAPYGAAKAGVVSLTESLAAELRAAGSSVRVSVLCPGYLETGLARTSAQVVPSGAAAPPSPAPDPSLGSGAPPLSVQQVVELALDGVAEDRLHILTHPEANSAIRQRVERLLLDLD
ncbi:MAG: putative short chain dehydrogenase, partial [Frankiales bacterium]|nr:putative short chain dehydrogenase [Frankiales bacterium]